MQHFKTVLGDIAEKDLGITLVHEHICCYSEYAYQMVRNDYFDNEWCTMDSVLADNAQVLELAQKHKVNYILIDDKYEVGIKL